jgi:hypothetical protein
MPKATSGGFPMHLWRVNTNPGYRTFPTAAEFGVGATATKKIANASLDGAYTEAVWVDVDYACGQCHGGGPDQANPVYAEAERTVPGAMYYNKTTLAAFAVSIHENMPMPVASFTSSYDPLVSYKVDFNASGSTCPAEVAPCTYDWDFTNNGSNDASGITATNTYGGTAAQTVKLTVTDSLFRTAVQTKVVSPQPKANTPPVAAFTITQNGAAVTVTNTSSDVDGDIASAQFYLTWGDGTSEPIATGLTTFAHTYASAGTFTITLLATDPQSAQHSTSQPVTVTIVTFTIGGTVTAGPAGSSNVNSVLLTLKRFPSGTVVANTYTGATGSGPFSYSFANLAAGQYTVTATKTGAVFAETNPTAAITVGPDSTGNNFTTVKTKFRISFTAKGSGGANLSGVTITVKNANNQTVAQGVTNASGVYQTNMVLPAGTYTSTATKYGRSFNSPPPLTFVNGDPDGVVNFVSTTP